MPHHFTPDYYPAGILCPGGNCENGANALWAGVFDYYPGVYPVADGRMQTPDYQWNTSRGAYRWGFNSMEKDDELKGSGNSYDFGARIYDPRVGRWLAVDPWFSKFPAWSPNTAFNNNPLVNTDPTGKGGVPTVVFNDKGEPIKVIVSSTLYIYTDDKNIDIHNAAFQIKEDIMTELNNKSFTKNIRYKPELSRNYRYYKNVEIEFNITAIPINSFEKVKLLAAVNDIKQDFSVNFLYVHSQEAIVGINHTAGGNSGVLNINSTGKVKAHEFLHVLGFRTGVGPIDFQQHWDCDGCENRLMTYRMSYELWESNDYGAKATQEDISGINFGKSIDINDTNNKGFGESIKNNIYDKNSGQDLKKPVKRQK